MSCYILLDDSFTRLRTFSLWHVLSVDDVRENDDIEMASSPTTHNSEQKKEFKTALEKFVRRRYSFEFNVYDSNEIKLYWNWIRKKIKFWRVNSRWKIHEVKC
jgi:hypothetical protein